jgi:carbonic anhydrase/acetyltransferase-like protein (isoleucine patch superfamily)
MYYAMPGSTIIPYKGTYPTLGSRAFVAAGAHIIGDVIAEEDVSIWFNTVVRGDCNSIRIGARTNIQDGTVIHVTSKEFATEIGSDVTIGHNVILHGCKVGSGTLIGMGAILLDGVEIGEKCFVAAGSLVTPGKKFPPHSMIMGSPAKVARTLTEEDLAGLATSVPSYLEYKNNYFPQ